MRDANAPQSFKKRCLRPAGRVGEDHAERAAAALACLVGEDRAVRLAEFAGDEEPQTGAAGLVGEERFEDPLGVGRRYAGTPVRDLEERPPALFSP